MGDKARKRAANAGDEAMENGIISCAFGGVAGYLAFDGTDFFRDVYFIKANKRRKKKKK